MYELNPSEMRISAIILISLFLLSCDRKEVTPPFVLEGITQENFPRIDGSTSVQPLQTLIACKLLGARYEWRQALHLDNTWGLLPDYDDVPYEFFRERIKTSQTHQSFINLIDNEADLTLSARKMSDDEKAYADSKGVTLIETPIALDALVFLLNPSNPVKSLTSEQLRDIYLGKLTNWKEVGGRDVKINPYIRNANSGSQELMEALVMQGQELPEWPEEIVSTMLQAFVTIRNDVNGICYTVYYYKDRIVRDNENVKSLAVNGIYPDQKSISSRTYPYTAEVYVVIRSDLDRNSMAYKLYELLQTPAGKSAIRESGYIPN